MADDKTEKIWDLFEKLSDKDKIDWLLEFEFIGELIEDWSDDNKNEEIKRLQEKIKQYNW